MAQQDSEFSTLLEALQAETGGNILLASLLQRGHRPSADDYIEMNWGDASFETDDEDELRVIEILRQLDAIEAVSGK